MKLPASHHRALWAGLGVAGTLAAGGLLERPHVLTELARLTLERVPA